MSEGAIALRTRQYIMERGFDGRTQGALIDALEAARPGPLQFFWEAGAEAGLSAWRLKALGGGLFFLFASANLTDDLVDGDCDYLADPGRDGPIVVFILRSLSTAILCEEAGLEPPSLCRAHCLLAEATSGALVELATAQWTAARWLQVGEAIAGKQYQAYMTLLWQGTALEPLAEAVGRDLGLVAHLYHDIKDRDPRLLGQPEEDRRHVIAAVEERWKSLGELADRRSLMSIKLVLSALDWRTMDVTP